MMTILFKKRLCVCVCVLCMHVHICVDALRGQWCQSVLELELWATQHK